jgi:hypothetical protein
LVRVIGRGTSVSECRINESKGKTVMNTTILNMFNKPEEKDLLREVVNLQRSFVG